MKQDENDNDDGKEVLEANRKKHDKERSEAKESETILCLQSRKNWKEIDQTLIANKMFERAKNEGEEDDGDAWCCLFAIC